MPTHKYMCQCHYESVKYYKPLDYVPIYIVCHFCGKSSLLIKEDNEKKNQQRMKVFNN